MSTFLFAMPSFASGAGRSLDLGGHFDNYNESKNPTEADVRAMREDFAAVGKDISTAMSKTSAERG